MPPGTSSKQQQRTMPITAEASAHDPHRAMAMLREKVATISDPKERERIVKEAYRKEVEAHGESKFAKMIQSGAWQGLAAGGGIGAGVGIGLGTVVGTVVGGVVSIPTTALGGLIGSGVGAVHGPWIKIPKGGDQAASSTSLDRDRAAEADVVFENGQQRTSAQEGPRQSTGPDELATNVPARKRPRKLEVRAQPLNATEQERSEQREKARKPKKLEVRSQAQNEMS
ncbi:hypothetical protein TI39_contig562g00026 [Zymoseptoria brevis]|uniref:Uncharacterized protein n=1 Tax=Zymoseptoria brevis TaxID=1047168 RepID=A0A0F4GJ50_9PEZI|nr:hypothetical protein TI39_contig562g00026 [Zymoseptoria brevis]